jgi:hypothetical protein
MTLHKIVATIPQLRQSTMRLLSKVLSPIHPDHLCAGSRNSPDTLTSKCLLMACAVIRRRFAVGAGPNRRNAPAGRNRSSYGGEEVAEAFG